MKTKQIIAFVVFLMLVTTVMAQPLPPESLSGNPVPVEGLSALLPIAMVALGLPGYR